jgi:hypothetical protein
VLVAWALGLCVARCLSEPANRWLRRRMLKPASVVATA